MVIMLTFFRSLRSTQRAQSLAVLLGRRIGAPTVMPALATLDHKRPRQDRSFSSSVTTSENWNADAIEPQRHRRMESAMSNLVRRSNHILKWSAETLVMQQLVGEWLHFIASLQSEDGDSSQLNSSIGHVDAIAHLLLDRLNETKKVKELGFFVAPQTKEVIRLYVKLGNGRRAEALFQKLQQGTHGHWQLLVEECLTDVIGAYTNDFQSKDFLQKALHLFHACENPPLEAYNHILNCYRRTGQAEEAEKFFEHLRSEHVMHDPDQISYSALMNVWVATKQRCSQQKVEKLLLELKENYELHGRPENLLPNSYVYGTAMTLASPQRAEQLLFEMQSLYLETKDDSIAPDTRYYLKVMQKWASVGNPQATESLLAQLEQHHKAGQMRATPTLKCFTTVMDAYTKQRTLSGVRNAERILTRMELQLLNDDSAGELHNYAYNIVLDGFSRTSQDPSLTQAVFDRMVNISRRYPNIQPDKYSYTALMRAIAETEDGSGASMERVFCLLTEMEQSGGNAQPDVVTYGVIFGLIDRFCGDNAPIEGRKLFDRMRERGVEPNEISYNSLMLIFAKRGNPKEAIALLEEMKRIAERGNESVRPGAREFAVCINGYAKGGQVGCFQKSYDLFIDSYNYCGAKNFKSGANIVTSVLVALAKDYQVENKAQAAEKVMDMAKSFDIEDTVPARNALLKAMATESGTQHAKDAALQLAVSSFQTMRGGKLGTIPTSYITLMTCCNKLIDNRKERTCAIDDIMNSCCKDGFVTEAVISHHRHFCPASTLLENLSRKEGGAGLAAGFPPAWERNAKHIKPFRRQRRN